MSVDHSADAFLSGTFVDLQLTATKRTVETKKRVRSWIFIAVTSVWVQNIRMKYIIQNLLVFFYLILTGCVAAQVTETAPLKSTIQEQYDKSVELYTQALRDYSDKSYLFKNLEGTIKDESLQARLKDHLGYTTKWQKQ
jgi:hypothetical protein